MGEEALMTAWTNLNSTEGIIITGLLVGWLVGWLVC